MKFVHLQTNQHEPLLIHIVAFFRQSQWQRNLKVRVFEHQHDRITRPTLHISQQGQKSAITTGAGSPAGNKNAVMTVGPRGPLLAQDFVFFDEMMHFTRERIPERVVHAKGSGEFAKV